MAAEYRVAAIVLNYRTPELSGACVRSLLGELDPARDVALIVDNASADQSFERLREEFAGVTRPEVRVLSTPHNGGFSYGNNAGIRAVDADAYLLLNSDTLVRPRAVETLYQFLADHPRAGLVGPRLEWETGESQVSGFRFHRPISELIAGAATGPVTRALARWDVPLEISDQPRQVEWLSFASVMIRAEVIRAIGGLDDGYFMYYEDSDYCRCARRASFEIWQQPAARTVHLRGRSSPVKSLHAARKRLPRYYYASRARYFRKHYGISGLLAANLLWSTGRGISWLREKVGVKQPHTVERQLVDIWRG